VVHVHAIEVLARLVREDFDTHVAVPLGNRLKWIKVEYKKPGVDLARAVHEALAERSDADIVFLRNHGVVIGGSDIADIDSKLRLLVSLLESPVCETVPTRTAVKALKVNSGVEYQPIVDGSLHQLALNPALFERLGADWALYPDHVVFLGAQAHCYEDEKEFIESVVHNEVMPELAFIRGGGVLAQAGFSQAKQAQLRCYADVITRQPRDCALSSLSRSQIGELLNWDAERYRQQMAK
jgi:rhamnose utilization protein RhaD (predicted bifunctional aldolase and dehydrogenase)